MSDLIRTDAPGSITYKEIGDYSGIPDIQLSCAS